jgi:hypothetical protein
MSARTRPSVRPPLNPNTVKITVLRAACRTMSGNCSPAMSESNIASRRCGKSMRVATNPTRTREAR